MASQFYISTPSTATPSNADSTTSDLFGSGEVDYDFDSSTLPFPKPIDRSAFLSPGFDAAAFLTQTTTSRYQSLEDLQADLRSLLSNINKELVDLVNDNYASFLHLGDKLSGGDEKIEEVMVGLLGFRRDVEGVRDSVQKRSADVQGLIATKRKLMAEKRIGRSLLEVAERVDDLEIRLGIVEPLPAILLDDTKTEDVDDVTDRFEDWGSDFDEDVPGYIGSEEDEANENGVPPRLRHNLDRYFTVKHLIQKIGLQHPFVLSMKPRLAKLQEMLSQDIDVSARETVATKEKLELVRLRSQLEK